MASSSSSKSSVNHVVFYHKPTCPFCKMARHLLEVNGIKDAEIKMINVQEDSKAFTEMHEKYGKTVPQIIINNVHVGGCDDLMDTLDQGGFQALLK